jgi:type II protein arginine methyltransferase
MTDWIENLPSEIRAFVTQLRGLPDFPEQLAAFAMVMRQRQQGKDAVSIELARRAWELAPGNPRVRRAVEWAVRRNVPTWHFSIVRDLGRNEAYERALRHFVTPDTIVLEIGTGTGLLAMMAARAGARHVYSCEMEPWVAEAAWEIIARNGYADRVTVIPKKSTDLVVGEDIPAPVDLLVSEILDNSLLGEGVLPTMEDALDRLVRPGAPVLPVQVAARCALVDSSWAMESWLGDVDGFDLSAFNHLAPLAGHLNVKGRILDNALSDDVEILRFDFNLPASYLAETKEVALTVRRDGIVHGVLQWIWLGFTENIQYDNRPPAETNWNPIFYVFPEPRRVHAGDTVRLMVEHDHNMIMIWPV